MRVRLRLLLARYAHRYVMERAATGEKMTDARTRTSVQQAAALARFRAQYLREARTRPGHESHAFRFGATEAPGLLEGETIVIGTATDPRTSRPRENSGSRAGSKLLAESASPIGRRDHPDPLVPRAIVCFPAHPSSVKSFHPFSLITLTTARTLGGSSRGRPRRNPECARWPSCGRSGARYEGVNCMPVLPGITDKRPISKRFQ